MPVAERLALAREVFAGEPRVQVETFDGLLVDFAARAGADGDRARVCATRADFEYEWPMTVTNRHLRPGIETVFLVPAPEVSAISSRLVKEIWRLGGDISGLVPAPVQARLRALGAMPGAAR